MAMSSIFPNNSRPEKHGSLPIVRGDEFAWGVLLSRSIQLGTPSMYVLKYPVPTSTVAVIKCHFRLFVLFKQLFGIPEPEVPLLEPLENRIAVSTAPESTGP